MKKLIMVNGTMGVGKTTICKELYQSINNSCWLDGDWCWTMNPFRVTEENKEMVLDNIIHLLNNFLKNASFECIIFNWVMQYESIITSILDRLNLGLNTEVIKISLVCSEEELEKRIKKDVRRGIRDIEAVSASKERLALYNDMDTIKIKTDNFGIDEIVDKIKINAGFC
ncbi:MAG: AAA family ATPase [Spirochaetales bacterium]|nr:AAA family ATPase [Spirochaetales bacterium]